MRRISIHLVCIALTVSMSGCGSNEVASTVDEPVAETADPQVLGVCFMGGDACVSTYVDLGPYEGPEVDKTETLVPVYIFPAVSAEDGGRGNPLDPNGHYRPFRLQNNVFADHGYVWQMWFVYSAELNLMAEPQPGMRIWGVDADQRADFKSGKIRDLFVSPIRSEKEILDLADRGLIRIHNTFRNTDCPMVPAKPGDEVINLNPGFPFCNQ